MNWFVMLAGGSNPCRRGDDFATTWSTARTSEQPPQARGRPLRLFGGEAQLGATPAGAGTTSPT